MVGLQIINTQSVEASSTACVPIESLRTASAAIDHVEKIGIGTYPIAGSADVLSGVKALHANWFYTWRGHPPAGEITGWMLGEAASSGGVVANRTLLLGNGVDGWASRDFVVAGNQSLTLTFAAESFGGIVLNYLDAAGSVIGTSYRQVRARHDN